MGDISPVNSVASFASNGSDDDAKAISRREDDKKAQLKENEKKDKEREEAAMNPVDRAALGNASHAIGESIALSIISGVLG
jgi:hypothetical protein